MGLFSSRMKGSLFLQAGQLSGLYTKIFTLLHRFFFHPTSLFSISLTSIFSAPLSLRFPFIFNPLFSLSLLCLFLSSSLFLSYVSSSPLLWAGGAPRAGGGRLSAAANEAAAVTPWAGDGRDWLGGTRVQNFEPKFSKFRIKIFEVSVLLDPTDMILFRLNFFVFFHFSWIW